MNTLHDIRYAIAGSLAEFDLDLGLAPQALCLRPLSRAKSAIARTM